MTTLATLRTFCQDRMQDATETKAIRIYDRAINQAFRYIAMHDFPFYRKEGRIVTAPTYSTGHLSLTQDSNSATAGSGAVFSTSYNGYGVTITGVSELFRVAAGSTSSLVFGTNQNWLLSAATKDYTLFKDRIAMPTDLRKFDRLRNVSEQWSLSWIPPEKFKDIKLATGTAGASPVWYTVDGDYFYLWPYPTTRASIDFWYYKWPTVLSQASESMDWDENALELALDVIGVTLKMNDPIAKDRISSLEGKEEIKRLCQEWQQSFNEMKDEVGLNIVRPMGGSPGAGYDWPIGADQS